MELGRAISRPPPTRYAPHSLAAPPPTALRCIARQPVPVHGACLWSDESQVDDRTAKRDSETAFHNDRTLCVHISLPAVSHVTRTARLHLVAVVAAFSMSLIGCEALV